MLFTEAVSIPPTAIYKMTNRPLPDFPTPDISMYSSSLISVKPSLTPFRPRYGFFHEVGDSIREDRYVPSRQENKMSLLAKNNAISLSPASEATTEQPKTSTGTQITAIPEVCPSEINGDRVTQQEFVGGAQLCVDSDDGDVYYQDGRYEEHKWTLYSDDPNDQPGTSVAPVPTPTEQQTSENQANTGNEGDAGVVLVVVGIGVIAAVFGGLVLFGRSRDSEEDTQADHADEAPKQAASDVSSGFFDFLPPFLGGGNYYVRTPSGKRSFRGYEVTEEDSEGNTHVWVHNSADDSVIHHHIYYSDGTEGHDCFIDHDR